MNYSFVQIILIINYISKRQESHHQLFYDNLYFINKAVLTVFQGH